MELARRKWKCTESGILYYSVFSAIYWIIQEYMELYGKHSLIAHNAFVGGSSPSSPTKYHSLHMVTRFQTIKIAPKNMCCFENLTQLFWRARPQSVSVNLNYSNQILILEEGLDIRKWLASVTIEQFFKIQVPHPQPMYRNLMINV